MILAHEQRRIIVHDLARSVTKHLAVGQRSADTNPRRLIDVASRIVRFGIAALPNVLQLVPETRRPDAEKELLRLWPEGPISELAFPLVLHALRFSRETESIVHIRFSGDGDTVYCGTSNGLRAYAWADLISAADDTPIEPRLYFNPPADRLEATTPSHGYVYATVEDPTNNRVLFGGMDGRIRGASLDSGEVSTLLDPPEQATIMEMHIVGQSTLVCRVTPGFADPKKRPKTDLKQRLQVWNLR